jgi:pimeloyl-ACP methyl ester carboxylesterase
MEAYLPFALLGGSICGAVWWMFWRPIADRATPEQRRAKWPPQEDEARRAAQPGLRQALKPVPDAELKVSQGYYTLKAATIDGRSGQKLHYTIVTPADGDIQRVITFVHGYGDFHDWLMMNAIRACAKLFKAAVVGFDLPGHGRSDGFYAFVPDWFEFVGAAEDLMRNVSVPLCTSLAPTGSKPLKHFAYGISMGGGLLATVMLRPSGKELLDGVILDAPMLYVSDEIKPPWAVQMLFKHVIIKLPFVGSWPVAPSKDVSTLRACISVVVAPTTLRGVMLPVARH